MKLGSDIFRIFYFLSKQNVAVLLHGIVKKSQKLPQKELDIAKNRMAKYIRRHINGME